MSSQYFQGLFSQLTGQACVIDTTPPTFAGLNSAAFQTDGSVLLSWLAGSTTKAPLRYEVYAAAGTLSAAALFLAGNKVTVAVGLSTRLFTLSDFATYFTPGQVYTFGVRAIDSQNYTDTNTVVSTQTALYPNYGSLAGAVWDQLKSAHTISGSFGDYLDAKVSLAQTAATALTQYNNLQTAIGTLQTAATALSQYNSLNSAIGLVQTAATALSQYNALIAAIGTPQQTSTALTQYNNLQTAIGLVQTAATALSQFNTLVADITAIPTNPLLTTDSRLNNLDATISSRLAASSYVAPNNAGIAAIKAVTDQFLFDGSSFVKANAQVVADKTGYDLLTATVNAIAGAVWEQTLAAHNTAGTFGANAQNPPLSPSAVAAAVWNALIASYNVPGSFGANAQTPAINPTQVAQAVWNALIASYNTPGTFGNTLQNPAISPTQVAQAVWNALTSSYVVPGTFGAKVGSGGGGTGGIPSASLVDPDLLVGKVINPQVLVAVYIDE